MQDDIADVAKNADDIEWYLDNKGRQLEEEISKADFITPIAHIENREGVANIDDILSEPHLQDEKICLDKRRHYNSHWLIIMPIIIGCQSSKEDN
ncbi:MAG: hypothetical protein Q7J78_05215 [Clostridiales bacterium]|nr:hypothetical protein [Clostridiales bacterium]